MEIASYNLHRRLLLDPKPWSSINQSLMDR
jgi:hypothetical protein